MAKPRSKRISVDLTVRREKGIGNLGGTSKNLEYIVLETHGFHSSQIWLSPGEARKLAEYITRVEK